MSAVPEVVEVAVLVARALESIGVDYALGGSVATSVQGEPRSTNDIDFGYLRRWATQLGVADLLERALSTKTSGP